MLAGNLLWILVHSWLEGFPATVVAQAGKISIGGVKQFSCPKPHDNCILFRTGPDSHLVYTQKC